VSPGAKNSAPFSASLSVVTNAFAAATIFGVVAGDACAAEVPRRSKKTISCAFAIVFARKLDPRLAAAAGNPRRHDARRWLGRLRDLILGPRELPRRKGRGPRTAPG